MEIIGIDKEKKYIRSFVGIALPENLVNDFRGVLLDLQRLDKDLLVVDEKTPHVLISYLGNQTGDTLMKVAEKIDNLMSGLAGISLDIEGVGYFQNGNRKVIFLSVANGERLKSFADGVRSLLLPVTGDEKGFVPHLTIARKRGMVGVTREAEKRLALVRWRFEIDEVAIYGALSQNGEVRQEKLIRWKI